VPRGQHDGSLQPYYWLSRPGNLLLPEKKHWLLLVLVSSALFITVRQLLVCWCGVFPLLRGQICWLQPLLSLPSTIILPSHAHSRLRSPYLYAPGTGWPSYILRRVPFSWSPMMCMCIRLCGDDCNSWLLGMDHVENSVLLLQWNCCLVMEWHIPILCVQPLTETVQKTSFTFGF
jgi:hypothetical protein